MSEILPLFYVPVYRDIVDWDCSELDDYKNPATHRPHDLSQISKTEYQAVRMLENFPDLKTKILNKFYDYATQLQLHKIKWKISTSWVTHVEKGQNGAEPHVHKNCEFSGLLYFEDDYRDQPPLEIDNPLSVFTSFYGGDSSFENQYMGTFTVDIQKGLLIFFPSYLRHQVGRVTRDKPRRSLAVNFAPTGYYGQGDSVINTRWLNS